jgi:hypothetical protein
MSKSSENDRFADLPEPQRAAIVELGSLGSGGEFDSHVMSELFAKALITVRPEKRRVVLTELGQQAFGELTCR